MVVSIKSYLDGETWYGGGYRYTRTFNRSEMTPQVDKKTAIFIAYGQSNATNTGKSNYVVTEKVFQLFRDKIYFFKDPGLGGAGQRTSVWGLVGDKLIKNGLYDQVIFSLAGMGNKTLKQLTEEEVYEYFKSEYITLLSKYGRVDAILFHQGENNNGRSSKEYKKQFKIFLSKLSSDGINSPIFLSQASYCNKRIDNELTEAQNSLIETFKGVLRGPNTDLIINNEYRYDFCHFSHKGLEEYSDMWVTALMNYSET